MTIAIFGSPYPEHFTKYIQHLVKKLESEHVKIIIEEDFNNFLQNNIRFTSKIEVFKSTWNYGPRIHSSGREPKFG